MNEDYKHPQNIDTSDTINEERLSSKDDDCDPILPNHRPDTTEPSSSVEVVSGMTAKSSVDFLTWENILNVTPIGPRRGRLVLTETHLIFTHTASDNALEEDYDDEIMPYLQSPGRQANNASGFMLSLELISEVLPRCYKLRDGGFEIFSFTGPRVENRVWSDFSIYLAFDDPGDVIMLRNEVVHSLKERFHGIKLKFWPSTSLRDYMTSLVKTDPLTKLTKNWRKRRISNFDYLMKLNFIAGRSKNDLSNYIVFPWVLNNYSSKILDLDDRNNYRDLSKPMGALDEERLQKFIGRYKALKKEKDDLNIPFMYGSHYSSKCGVVLHYLIRKRPFTGLHRKLQGGKFDIASRLFDSVRREWEKASKDSFARVNELIPEFYSDPSFLRNENSWQFGEMADGKIVSDVLLPPWAEGSAENFVNIMRKALESEICSESLHNWIDLIFGYRQQGKEAKRANNVFHQHTYYTPRDLDNKKEYEKQSILLQVDDFGSCPQQLFFRPHPRRKISVEDECKDDDHDPHEELV